MADIIVHGLTQNNLKHVTFRIPKEQITVLPESQVPASLVSSLTPLPLKHSADECNLSGICTVQTSKISQTGSGAH